MVWILLCGLLLFIYFKFIRKIKRIKFSAIAVFTGAVKTFKSGTSLHCAIRRHRISHLSWRIKTFFLHLFHSKRVIEEPMIYSNIPLATIPFVPLEMDHILRKKRFNYKSTVYIDEASLLADCYLSKFSSEHDIQITLLKFFKLFGHETKGGFCVLNSQSMSDLNIALRKCTNQNYYIHSSKFLTLLPFVIVKLREERYVEDGTSINSYNEDIEDSMKTIIVPKNILKKYDCYAFSILTDDLPHDNNVILKSKKDSLKITDFVSFRKEFREMFIKGEKNEK